MRPPPDVWRRLPTDDPRPLAGRVAKATGRIRAPSRGAPRTPQSHRVLPRPAPSEATADGIDELLPHCTPLAELAPAALGKRIDAPPSPGVGRHPAAGKQAGLLEAMQDGVDRPLWEVEGARAPALD